MDSVLDLGSQPTQIIKELLKKFQSQVKNKASILFSFHIWFSFILLEHKFSVFLNVIINLL